MQAYLGFKGHDTLQHVAPQSELCTDLLSVQMCVAAGALGQLCVSQHMLLFKLATLQYNKD